MTTQTIAAVKKEKSSPSSGAPAPAGASEEASNLQLVAWMMGFLRPVRWLCALACLYLVLAIGGEVLAVRQTAEVVNRIKELHLADSQEVGFWAWFRGGDAADLRTVLLVLGGLVAALSVLRYLREVANMRLSMTMVYHIRAAVYDKLQQVGFAFHDRISTGQLINRALTDLQNVRQFIQTAVLMTLEIVLVVGGYITLLVTRSPWVALLSLAPLPVWTWYIIRFGKKMQPATKSYLEAEDKSVSIVTENIAGVHVVKAFATERQEIEKYQQACDTFFTRVMSRIRMYANFNPIIRTIGMVSHLTLFFAVAVLMIRRQLDAGDFLILGSAMGAILGRLQQVSAISDQYQNAVVSSRRLREILMAPPTVLESPLSLSMPSGPGAVRFEHVTFGYDPAKPVLKDVSFQVPGGSIVAIVGPTGSGKTTLVNLLARFYDPQQGRICIDSADLRDVKLASLRPQVAFVFQETYLFSDTVAANISYGKPHLLNGSSVAGEIEAAARLAQAHEFIEQLPSGYQTMLGERGASLSGGQRQRLAIARAILQDPRILVLDDATAAVDPETDDLIHRAMSAVMKGRTTFLIAHRISTAKRADIVLVLEDGRLTQMGTHDELMQQDGHYRQIAAVQLYGDDELDDEGEPRSHMKRMGDERKVSAAAEAQRGALPAQEAQV